jgi:hypothetical protein
MFVLLLPVWVLACSGSPPSDLFGGPPGGEAGAGIDSTAGTPDSGIEAAPLDGPALPEVSPPDEGGLDSGGDDGSPPDTGVDVGTVIEAGPPPVTVHCGQSTCTAPEFCCVTNAGQQNQMEACSTSLNDCSNQGGTTVRCTTSTQCGAGTVCCGRRPSSSVYQDVSCQPMCNSGNDRQFCDPSVANDCSQGTCRMSGVLASYYVCL